MNFCPAILEKKEIRTKFKNLPGINLMKYSSKFLAHIKKHLCHTGKPANIKNNCIKLSGFGVDMTQNSHFSTPGNNEKHSVPRKILQPENSFTGFLDHPHIHLPLSLPFSFGLNKTGNAVCSEYTEIYQ